MFAVHVAWMNTCSAMKTAASVETTSVRTMDWYNRQGQQISMTQWVDLMEDLNYRVVEQTVIPETSILVSTVLLGIDHNFFGEGPPIIFETMIFPNGFESPMLEDYCERYATEEQAREGHQRAIEYVVGPVLAAARGIGT